MTRYIIIDDEHIAHKIIMEYCDMLPKMQLQKNCYSALEALEYLTENSVELIFLDINMPKLKGFEFLKTLTNPPRVIVTTAYSEFALEGYELNVIDYLLKPFGFERFLKAVNKATSSENKTHSRAIKENDDSTSERIFFRSNKKHTQVIVDEIQYLEAAGNYTKIITINDSISVREKISDILNSLPKEDFRQVHKSFAVSIKRIQSIEGNRIHIGDHKVPIGKVYKLNIDDLLNQG